MLAMRFIEKFTSSKNRHRFQKSNANLLRICWGLCLLFSVSLYAQNHATESTAAIGSHINDTVSVFTGKVLFPINSANISYDFHGNKGAVILDRIRECAKTRELPVIFLTGVTERDRIQELLALKVQGYLMKPIDMEKVSSTIKGVLEQESV